MPHVVEREEQKVPVGGKPCQGEGCVELPEGQLGELRGARPGGAHAQHHRHAPEDLLELRPGALPARAAASPAGLRPSRRLGLRRARGVPGALLPWRKKRRGWLPGGHHASTSPPRNQGVGGTPLATVKHPHPPLQGGAEGWWQLSETKLKQKTFSLGLVTLQDLDPQSVVEGVPGSISAPPPPRPSLVETGDSQAPLQKPRIRLCLSTNRKRLLNMENKLRGDGGVGEGRGEGKMGDGHWVLY